MSEQYVWVIEYRLSDMSRYEWRFLSVADSEGAAKYDIERFNKRPMKWYSQSIYEVCRNRWSDGRMETIRIHRCQLITATITARMTA